MSVRKDIKCTDWVEIKYDGRTYLVAVKSLILAWMHEENAKRKQSA